MTLFTHVTRRICYTDDELDSLAQEFADYAALDITDILKLQLPHPDQDYRVALIATEIAHAIRTTIATLTVTSNPPAPYRSPAPRALHEFEPLKVHFPSFRR